MPNPSRVRPEDPPPPARTIDAARSAASTCRACALWKDATQTVFGDGPRSARIVIVGEQPGDREDLAGEPFIGPAGRLLDEALVEAGIDRTEVYITNVVKHFKFERKGKRRIHKKPYAEEIRACTPWLEQEMQLIRPRVLVALGATAATALLGRKFKLTEQHGRFVQSAFSERTLATIHPSAVIRAPEATARAEMRAMLVADLRVVARELHAGAA